MNKSQILKENNIELYANGYNVSNTLMQASKMSDGLEASLAGRIMAIRSFGRLSFFHIQDQSNRFQIALKKGVCDDYSLWIKALDIGDFIGVSGTIFTTNKGEKTLNVENLTLLSKSLRQLPEKWHGVKDKELLYRKRYLDLIMNNNTKQRFILRSNIINFIRSFLVENNFLEVETPILQPVSCGASAKPFKTHHNTLKEDLYLRIAPETYLKRLIAGGFDRVFEIGKNFRNEGKVFYFIKEEIKKMII